jgi:uncharacterized membrane protein (UPF0136 family)
MHRRGAPPLSCAAPLIGFPEFAAQRAGLVAVAAERHDAVTAHFVALERFYDERDQRHTEHFRALETLYAERDRRYEQRFEASSTAMTAAFVAQQAAITAALAAADRAVTKAELATEKRFEAVNEFRGSLSDLTSTMMTRTESTVLIGALTEKVELLAGFANRHEGSASSVSQLVPWVLTALFGMVGFAGLIYDLTRTAH